jgi:hypothetical protein
MVATQAVLMADLAPKEMIIGPWETPGRHNAFKN